MKSVCVSLALCDVDDDVIVVSFRLFNCGLGGKNIAKHFTAHMPMTILIYLFSYSIKITTLFPSKIKDEVGTAGKKKLCAFLTSKISLNYKELSG
jgi:hypothetical protein